LDDESFVHRATLLQILGFNWASDDSLTAYCFRTYNASSRKDAKELIITALIN
jgi:hypothetical protein